MEVVTGGSAASFPSLERAENVLVNFILPLCIVGGSGRRDALKLKPSGRRSSPV